MERSLICMDTLLKIIQSPQIILILTQEIRESTSYYLLLMTYWQGF